MVVDVALWFISEYHTFKIKCDLRMVMRLVTMYGCIILGLVFIFAALIASPGWPSAMWPFFIGIPLLILGILNVRMRKKLMEQKKRKNLDT